MKRIVMLAGLLAAGAAGASMAAEMTLYKQPHFSGQDMTVRRDASDLSGAGFQDQVSSIVVKSGRWQICTQPAFKGDCVVIGRGEYPTLHQALNHRVESVRQVEDYARRDRNRDRSRGDRNTQNRGGYGSVAVEAFVEPGFRGRAVRVDDDIEALRRADIDGGISSLVIHEGRWQVCTRPGFEGRCEVYEPGRYADLGRLENRVGSMRRIG